MSRKVAIYARVSTEHEAQIAALDNQVQYYAELLAKHPEFELYDRYIDEGITGTSVKKRPSFLRMMEDAKRGCFDLIITREVSRFARNTVDTLQETRKLKAMGVEVWFTEDNIWTMDDSDGELRLTIMATLAQNESKKTSMRVKAGQMISFKNGVPYGNGNILGYDKLPNHGGYVINPEQAETVRMIFDMYLAGDGLRAIQFKLEQAGRKTASGLTNWHCSNISRVLKNPFYCGILEYRKQYVPDYLEQKKINNHGAVDRIRVKGTHETIITEAEHAAVMARIDERVQELDSMTKKQTGLRDHADIWGKKLICCCGKKFRRVSYHTPRGSSKRYAYQCGSQVTTGSIGTRLKKGLPIDGICTSQFVQDWKLEVQAAVIFDQFFNDKKAVLKFANELFDAKSCIIGKKESKEAELEKLYQEIDKTEKIIDKLLDLRLADEITREEYAKKRGDLEKLVDQCNAKIEEISKYEEAEDGIEERVRLIKDRLEGNAGYDYSRIPPEVIDAFVEKIVVYEEYIEWHLYFDKGRGLKMTIKGNKKHHEVSWEVNTTPEGCTSTGCNR
ncbi:MAG: recombinase family protein [Clostridia bacterium]|nr:recombinase family protein [Clostridia bacterium]